MAEAQAFNIAEPPKRVTDPQGLGAQMNYPRHVYKYGEVVSGPQSTAMPVGWTADGAPIVNSYRSVVTAEDHARATEDGWSDVPVLTAPKAGKAAKG